LIGDDAGADAGILGVDRVGEAGQAVVRRIDGDGEAACRSVESDVSLADRRRASRDEPGLQRLRLGELHHFEIGREAGEASAGDGGGGDQAGLGNARLAVEAAARDQAGQSRSERINPGGRVGQRRDLGVVGSFPLREQIVLGGTLRLSETFDEGLDVDPGTDAEAVTD
jgi:hypothetical protein